jgi:hypothetical protein
LNSTHIRKKFEQGSKFQAIVRSKSKPRDIAEELYLTILSRLPTGEELRTVGEYCTSDGTKGNAAAMDIAWALINSVEFQHRH